MRVSIISKSTDWLDTCFTAVRTCKSDKTPQELLETETRKRTYDDKLRLLKAVYNSKHLSVFEHAFVTFAVSDVSRTLLAQYTRHRIGVSFSVQSQRYVSEATGKNGGFDMVMPASIANNETAKKAFSEGVVQAQSAYDAMIVAGVKAEDARFILPGGACTNFVTSLNLRSLLDVYEKRAVVKGAQWEIRQMLESMMELVKETEPWVAELVGD